VKTNEIIDAMRRNTAAVMFWLPSVKPLAVRGSRKTSDLIDAPSDTFTARALNEAEKRISF